MKHMIKFTALILTLLVLCGCSKPAVPAAPVFDAAAVEEAPYPQAPAPQRIIRSEVFQNEDGSAEFTVNIDTDLPALSLPVVEAVPRALTAQDAHDLIYAFFPDAQCYERHPAYSSAETSWTKESLGKEMERWRAYTYDDLAGIWGGVDNLPQAMRVNGDDIPFAEYWEENMQYFEDLLEKAPEADMRTPSLWHMFKETEYMVEPEEAERMDLSQDRDCVIANVEVGEDTYYYVVASGNPLFGTTNLISLSYNTPDSPANVDWQIFLSENEALPVPSKEDLDRALQVAQSYLDKFHIGEWVLDEPQPSSHDGTIYVEGHPADTILPEEDTVLLNATQFQMPYMSIRIHPDGRLLDFRVSGSLTEAVVRAEHPEELPVETLMDTALNHLRTEETMAYGLDEESLYWVQIWAEEDVRCQAEVTRLARGYVRMNTPEGGICYAPCLALYGTASYIGKESGKVLNPAETAFLPVDEIPLVIVNAIDGTIVPVRW